MLAAPKAGAAEAPNPPGLPKAGAAPNAGALCGVPKAGAADPKAVAAAGAPNAGYATQRNVQNMESGTTASGKESGTTA